MKQVYCNKINILTFNIILFFSTIGFAQHQQISFKHLSTVDGLSNFTVLSIAQDQQGFMWFGTMDGLNRFDGKQIKIYREDPTDSTSLGNNFIYSLQCTSDSGLWVGTNRGLYYYDYYHDNFHSIPILSEDGIEISNIIIRDLFTDESWLWIGTSHGLFRYDLLNNEFVSFEKDSAKPIGHIYTISKSNDGILWIGGAQVLATFRKERFNDVAIELDSVLSDPFVVISISFDASGKIWFGTIDRQTGLIIYDPATKSTKELAQSNGYLPNNKVNCLHRFEDGTIWAGTTWGLSIINEKTFDVRQLVNDRQNQGSISQNSVKYIFQGNNGIIWVGTFSGGVNYFDQKSQRISHVTDREQGENNLSFNIVSSIYEDKNELLWIGTEYGGVNIYNKFDKIFSVLKKTEGENSLIGDNIKKIVEDQDGRKFIATIFGLTIYDPVGNSYINITNDLSARGQLDQPAVHDVCMDNSGNMWLGIAYGLNGHFHMYDAQIDSIIHYYPENRDFPVVNRVLTNSLTYDKSRNVLWSGGNTGLAGFDVQAKKYITFEAFFSAASRLEGTIINDLYLDNFGLLWIATFGRGLFVMDVETFQLRKINAEEGLHESSFYAIVGDDDGNIWTSVNARLLKISFIKSINDSIDRIETFGIQDGFPAQQYFRTAACKGKDGTLYFGGDDGYIAFNPQEVENIVFNPSVSILDVLVNGESLELRSEKDNQYLNVASLKKLSLTYDQSSFAIQFIAPNFINPDNTWYQYQLSGIHETWQDLGNSNTINFTELKAGDYELKIRASSDPDSFSDVFTSISLSVAPPYWGTPLAYFIYLMTILLLLYLLFTISRKWERLNQDLRFKHLQHEQEKEFNQRRIKFFTDISHELRTPLTLILAPLERIVKSNFGNVKIRNQLMLMLRNGDRMLQLINQLLDLRKLETGHMQLQVAKGNIVNFIKEVSLSFRELAHDRNIEFKVECSQTSMNVWFDRDKFEIILFNLLSNALKYTPDGGNICLCIDDADEHGNLDIHQQQEKEEIMIRIENTGKGIPEEHVEHIFKRFYSGRKINDPDKHSTGVGLEIVKNLVDLHRGRIFVTSTYDENGSQGLTRFTIILKRGKKHFAENDILKNYLSSEDISNYRRSTPSVTKDLETNPELETEILNDEVKEESVLIVEDNSEVRKLVVNIFRDQYNTYEANDGHEGLKIAHEKVPDLIISDIMMPVMDGIELCRNIKTNANTSHIPVILLTARTAVTFKYEGLETGADDYIIKPFNVEDLKIRSTNLIRQRKLLKERFSQVGSIIPAEISLTSVDEKLIQKTLDYISENIGNGDLTVDKIAKEIGMSRTNFYRKIKALTNLSAAEFLRKIRMDHAAQLLKTNKVRVSEVRFMVGISDADYFRECFKKQFGVTPKTYIESKE